nr:MULTISPECIES: hypothetical protein [unclassified Bradyrhizobium]
MRRLQQGQELVVDQRQIRCEVDGLSWCPCNALDSEALELASHDGHIAFVLNGDERPASAQRK